MTFQVTSQFQRVNSTKGWKIYDSTFYPFYLNWELMFKINGLLEPLGYLFLSSNKTAYWREIFLCPSSESCSYYTIRTIRVEHRLYFTPLYDFYLYNSFYSDIDSIFFILMNIFQFSLAKIFFIQTYTGKLDFSQYFHLKHQLKKYRYQFSCWIHT